MRDRPEHAYREILEELSGPHQGVLRILYHTRDVDADAFIKDLAGELVQNVGFLNLNLSCTS